MFYQLLAVCVHFGGRVDSSWAFLVYYQDLLLFFCYLLNSLNYVTSFAEIMHLHKVRISK
jgi:hypothetical protein